MRFTAVKKTWLRHIFWSQSKRNMPACNHDDCTKNVTSQNSLIDADSAGKASNRAKTVFLYNGLFGNNKFAKSAFIFFDIFLCYYAVSLAADEVWRFNIMLSHDLDDGFDLTRIVAYAFFWILFSIPFPSSIIFAFYEQAKKKTYLPHYLSTLTLLFLRPVFAFYGIYRFFFMAGFRLVLLEISICCIIIALIVLFIKGKYKIYDAAICRKTLYMNLILRLILISLLFVYICKCYDGNDLNGYLRNKISEKNNYRVKGPVIVHPNRTRLIHSFGLPLEIFENKIVEYGSIDNYHSTRLFFQSRDSGS